MRKLMTFGVALTPLLLVACAGASVSKIRTPLAPGAATKGHTFLVQPVNAAHTVFKGGFSAMGNWLNRHIDDSVTILVGYLSKHIQ